MEKLGPNEIITELQKEPKNNLLFFSPNYEPRSTSWLSSILPKLSENSWDGTILIADLFLSGANVPVLETFKFENNQGIKKLLGPKKAHTLHINLFQDDRVQLSSSIKGFLKKCKTPARIFIDFSCLPRTLIISLLNVFKDLARADIVDEVFPIYTWAQDYPRAGHPPEVGDLKCVYGSCSLHERFPENGKTAAAVFLGRHGFDSRQFIECVSSKRSCRVTPFVFFDRHNPLLSLEIMRANHEFLAENHSGIQYYLSMEQGYRLLEKWLLSMAINSEFGLFLVAPFGPKPLTIWSWLAIQRFLVQTKKKGAQVDIVRLTRQQLTAPYSLGSGGTIGFRIQNHELLGYKEPIMKPKRAGKKAAKPIQEKFDAQDN